MKKIITVFSLFLFFTGCSTHITIKHNLPVYKQKADADKEFKNLDKEIKNDNIKWKKGINTQLK